MPRTLSRIPALSPSPSLHSLPHSPIIRIGGKRIHPLPESLICVIQVDGSYRPQTKTAAVAFYMKTPTGSVLSQSIPVEAQNSTEAEWTSIYFGLQSALSNDYKDLHLQNDCLSIIQAFLPNANPPRPTYAKYFKTKIQTYSNEVNWVGISWIPRELNRADAVLL